MGVFNGILDCFSSCFGVSTQRSRTSPYPSYIQRKPKEAVHHSYPNRGSQTSYFGSQRSSVAAGRPSTSGLHRSNNYHTVSQPTQPRAAQKNDINYVFRDTINSSASTRTRDTFKSNVSRLSSSTSTAIINRPSNSTNMGHSELPQHPCYRVKTQAQINAPKTHPVKTPQVYQVQPPKIQPVKPKSEVKRPQAGQVPVEVKYYMKYFTCHLNAKSKDNSFKPESNVIYHNQWTACRAVIVDQFGKQLSNSEKIKLNSCSRVEFCQASRKGGSLHFNMKSIEIGNILISIQIDNFRLIKEFYVKCNPCSSAFSEMVIKKFDTSNLHREGLLFRVSIVDVFGKPVPSNSSAICELNIFSPDENTVEKRMHFENGNKHFDITVRGDRPWSKDLLVLLNGKSISPVTKFEFSLEERGKIEHLLENRNVLLSANDQVSLHDFIHRNGCRMFIPLLTGDDDGKFVPYNENNCHLQLLPGRKGYQLVCQNTGKYDILGADFAHINNIRRVLELKDRVDIEEPPNQANVIIDLSNVQSYLHSVCKEVVQHLLRGLYYRKKASEAAKVRMEWKKKLSILENVLSCRPKDSPSLELCKFFKDFFCDLMNKYNREACEELFYFFNFRRDESEVDLHGLLVADEKKLELLRLDMLRGSLCDEEIDDLFTMCKIKSFNGRKTQALKKELLKGEISDDEIEDFIERCQDNIRGEYSLEDVKQDLLQRRRRSKHVDAIICRFRLESDEAIRKLKETLESFDLEEAIKNNTPWLEIIVGAGRHSRIKNEQNIRPKVEKLLKERNLWFAAVNKGALVVTFETYSGPEPCFGEYYCENCNRSWKSSKSYVGKYQKCSRCHTNCWPVKQREKQKIVNYHRDGARPVKRTSRPHQSSLCQKCQELGYPCNEEDFYDSDY